MKKLLLLTGFITVFNAGSQAQCVQLLDQGFESGTFALPWTMGPGTYTTTVPSGNAPVGNYNLMLSSTGTNLFYEGASATFTPGQPTYMSWWMRSDVTSAANGYVVIGDGNIANDNGIIFCYFNTTSSLRFFNTGGYNHPITANTWYHVEARNMNWTTRTSDIYVDNVLILPGWAFRSTTATSVDRVHLFSLSASTAQYDAFVIGNPAVTGSAVSTGVSCFGGTNGSATVTAGGGTGVFTYSWAPTGGTAATATALAAGTYSCTITDAIGCTNVTTVTVTEPSALAVSTSQTDILCNGDNSGSATVSVSGGTPGYMYSWAPGNGNSATASGLMAGSYTCTITDANGCTATQPVSLAQPAQALMSGAANNGNVCPGDTAMLVGTAMGGTMNYTYMWMPGNLPGSVVSDVPAATTTYTLLVTDANGCTSSSTTTVAVHTVAPVSLGPDDASCASMLLDAFTPGATYLWNDGSTTSSITVMVSGPYNVIVTDANGCEAYDTINVTINSLPVAVGSAAMNFVCTGEPAVTLFGSPAGGTWSGAGVSASAFEPDTAGAGTHNLVYTYTDSLGCTAMDTVTVTVDLCLGVNEAAASAVNVYPNPGTGVFEFTCNSASPEITLTVTDVQGRVVYTSSLRNVAAGTRTRIDLSAESDGVYFLRVAGGASSSATKILLQH